MTNQEAIKILKMHRYEMGLPYQGSTWKANADTIACDVAITALEAQQADRWIPVTDVYDIPKSKGFYLFQTKGNKVHEWWFEDGKIYVDIIHDKEYLFQAKDMKAWRHLPETWKEEQSC